MGIFKKANNIYITVRDTYTISSGTSYEEAEEVIIRATDEINLKSAKKVIMQGLNGGVQYGTVDKEEPKIIMSYFTDLNDKILGNRGEIGQEVYLVIEGVNLAGKEADLDLTDNEMISLSISEDQKTIMENLVLIGCVMIIVQFVIIMRS